eukprot:TRINITY_DN7172_c0_g1_i1.p1 TRINITY_DN7172_c0_g1~~TRINITY_DN7172_c0_g1_i1.p1  ORF type:complete len:366 (+),score=57.11 TRINITY_DN7172_c0_g1_i1:81-1178(+)
MSKGPRIIFSDIDGTLAHFPAYMPSTSQISQKSPFTATYTEDEISIECNILPSTTSGPAYMPSAAIDIVRSLRASGIIFVLVTGARRRTLLERLRHLPDCDVAAAESGGRIYRFPAGVRSSLLTAAEHERFLDRAWAQRLAPFCGELCEAQLPPGELSQAKQTPLAELAQSLRMGGWSVDTSDYTTQIRIRLETAKDPLSAVQCCDPIVRLHADLAVLAQKTTPWWCVTQNLDKADIYPSCSGKGEAVRYLVDSYGFAPSDAVVMMDDDNDLPMAALVSGDDYEARSMALENAGETDHECKGISTAVHRVYLPSITGRRVAEMIQSPECRWWVAPRPGVCGTVDALQCIHRQSSTSTSTPPSAPH